MRGVYPFNRNSSLPFRKQLSLQYQKIVEVDGIKIQVELLDTAGTEQVRGSPWPARRWQRLLCSVTLSKFRLKRYSARSLPQFMALHSIYMKSGDGFVLVFSLTSLESLNELSSLRDQIIRLKEGDGYTAVSLLTITRHHRVLRSAFLAGA